MTNVNLNVCACLGITDILCISYKIIVMGVLNHFKETTNHFFNTKLCAWNKNIYYNNLFTNRISIQF